jgi:hypothetical protein
MSATALNGMNPARAMALEVADKYFQIEEMEDKEKCITEILFDSDHKLEVTITDGPQPASSEGKWMCTEDGGIHFTVMRRFSAGQPQIQDTDVGEFDFKVTREYIGTMEKVGGLIAFSGGIHRINSEEGDAEVGFFEMIDTTMSRLEDEGRVEHFKKTSLGGI